MSIVRASSITVNAQLTQIINRVTEVIAKVKSHRDLIELSKDKLCAVDYTLMAYENLVGMAAQVMLLSNLTTQITYQIAHNLDFKVPLKDDGSLSDMIRWLAPNPIDQSKCVYYDLFNRIYHILHNEPFQLLLSEDGLYFHSGNNEPVQTYEKYNFSVNDDDMLIMNDENGCIANISDLVSDCWRDCGYLGDLLKKISEIENLFINVYK